MSVSSNESRSELRESLARYANDLDLVIPIDAMVFMQ
jgi:hypothetical protein